MKIVLHSTSTSLSIYPFTISVLIQVSAALSSARTGIFRVGYLKWIKDKQGTSVHLTMAILNRNGGTFFWENLSNFSGCWFKVLKYLISFSSPTWTKSFSSLPVPTSQNQGTIDGKTGLLDVSWDGFCLPRRSYICLRLLKIKYGVSIKVALLW